MCFNRYERINSRLFKNMYSYRYLPIVTFSYVYGSEVGFQPLANTHFFRLYR